MRESAPKTAACAFPGELHLVGMDTVRFGRVLGSGARSAAKTLIQAIDAAKAENPSRADTDLRPTSEQDGTGRAEAQPRSTTQSATSPSAFHPATRITNHATGIRQGAGRFRDLALKPFVRLSGVLVLEVAGVFFGVFALYGFNTMWRAHRSWQVGSPNYREFIGGAIILAVFGYFCVTSFVRARRRERRH